MANLDTREWLLTNGLGSFASGTVADVRTRTYHGWLFAATQPPKERILLLSHLEASVEVAGKVVALGTNYWGSGEIESAGYNLLRSFDINPVPQWIWGEEHWRLSRQLIMPYGLVGEAEKRGEIDFSACPLNPVADGFCHRLLIQYRYEGKDLGILRLRLLISDRNLHRQQLHSQQIQFSQLLLPQQVCFQAIMAGQFGTPWHLRWTRGEYHADAVWYWDYKLSEETERGLSDREDLYSPGYLTIPLQSGDAVTLVAQVGFPNPVQAALTGDTFADAVQAEQERLTQIFGFALEKSKEPPAIKPQLLRASDQFIVYRASITSPTVIAGYHWFKDWTRNTLISLPGLALVPQRFDLAKQVLQTFGRHCRHGLIPNVFPDRDGEPSYNSIDVGLWWIETLGLYLEATQDWQFLAEQFPIVQQIHKAFLAGTRYNIQADATDGLVGWDAVGVALTWMDVVIGGQPVTPRRGKPVEINALWYSALCWLSQWAERLSQSEDGNLSVRLANQAQRYAQQAQQVKASLQKFWNPQLYYLYDTIEPDDRRNAQIRPNAVLALSLHHCGFSQLQGQQILKVATAKLLTPYGLRSLDPSDPQYLGKYFGNPQQRDRAYHQGTVWSWLIGPFVRAWQRFYPKEPLPFNWQPLFKHLLSEAGIGSISEIFDGDAPHISRGAIAQAWSVAEILRHLTDK